MKEIKNVKPENEEGLKRAVHTFSFDSDEEMANRCCGIICRLCNGCNDDVETDGNCPVKTEIRMLDPRDGKGDYEVTIFKKKLGEGEGGEDSA